MCVFHCFNEFPAARVWSSFILIVKIWVTPFPPSCLIFCENLTRCYRLKITAFVHREVFLINRLVLDQLRFCAKL